MDGFDIKDFIVGGARAAWDTLASRAAELAPGGGFTHSQRYSTQRKDDYFMIGASDEREGLRLIVWKDPWERSGHFLVSARGSDGGYAQWYELREGTAAVVDAPPGQAGNSYPRNSEKFAATSAPLLRALERAAAEARGGAAPRGPRPQRPAPQPPPGVLKRNDTSFPAKSAAKLRELYDRYVAARAAGDGWAGVLKYYQYLVRAVMSDPEYGIGADGNARGLLVYHTMGMGKTRLAVAVAMALWDVRQPVIMLARSLQKNFRETVAEVVAALNPDAAPEALARMQAEATARFAFVSMDAYNAADQMARVGTGAKTVKRGDITGATGGLDGKLLIVDEAHNFFRAIINSSAENANARRLYDMIMAARNLRILFLTGTPAAKDPFELVPCFNMLAGTDLLPTQYEIFYKLYVDREAHKVRNRERLANRLVGLVSHVTHLRPSEPAGVRDPGAAALAPKKPGDDGWFPVELPTIVERVEMGPDQYRQYLLAREKEEAEGRGGEGAGGRGAGVMTTPPLALPGSEKKAMRSYYVKSRSLSTFAAPREWAGSPVDAMPEEVFTAAIAPKLALIAERADKAPGPVLVYSQFVDAGGLKPLGRYLQRLGYAPFVPTLPPKERRKKAAETATEAAETATEASIFDEASGGGAVTIVPLEAATPAQLADLARIGSIEEVYSAFQGAKPLDAAYLESLRAAADGSYHWVILGGDRAVGYVGLHASPLPEYGGYLARYYVDPGVRGRGLAPAGVALALAEYWARAGPAAAPVWILTDRDNQAGARVAAELGYAPVSSFVDGNKTIDVHAPAAGGIAAPAVKDVDDAVSSENAISIGAAPGDIVGGAAEAKGHYAIISGEVPNEVRDAIKTAFVAPDNIRGARIKAILVSKTGAEGLDLKYLRETHQIEPYWDRARDDQVKARAVRIGCLDALPREDRVVQPYIYVATANRRIWEQMLARDREAKTIDEVFFDRALERYETNNAFRELCAEVSLECEIFGYGACRVCVPTNAPLFHDDPALDIRLPDPCEVRRETDVRAAPLRVGGVTYYYVADPASPLGYDFYVYRDDLGGYAAIDPSDPVIPELLAALQEG